MKSKVVMKLVVLVATSALAGCAAFLGPRLSERDQAAAYQQNFEKAMNTEAPIPEWAKHEGSVPDAQSLLVPAATRGLTWITPPPTFLKAYPVQDDWEMDRTPAGQITARHIRVAVYYKGGQSGFCRFEDTSLYQDEQGGRWGRPRFVGFGGTPKLGQAGHRVPCDQVDALPNPGG